VHPAHPKEISTDLWQSSTPPPITVKNPDPKDLISGFQVSGVRCQEKETEKLKPETSSAGIAIEL
jgi:hypothetical protein